MILVLKNNYHGPGFSDTFRPSRSIYKVKRVDEDDDTVLTVLTEPDAPDEYSHGYWLMSNCLIFLRSKPYS